MAVVPNPREAASYLGINARLDSVRTDLLTGPPRAENTSVDQGLQTDALTPPPPTVHPLHLPLHNPRSCQRRMGPRGHRPIISRASRCYNRSTQGPPGVIQSVFSDCLWNAGNSRQQLTKWGHGSKNGAGASLPESFLVTPSKGIQHLPNSVMNVDLGGFSARIGCVVHPHIVTDLKKIVAVRVTLPHCIRLHPTECRKYVDAETVRPPVTLTRIRGNIVLSQRMRYCYTTWPH